jgi:putative heme-binding domain-containing protein
MEINPLLEAFRDARSETVGLALVEALVAAKARSSLRPDLVQQCLDRFPASVQQAARELRVLLTADPAQQRARLDSLLEDLNDLPGDVRRGQQIFNSSNTACATCHAIGYLGGRVGPDLTSIGQVRTRRDLLEALVFPSASFVRNYEPVIVTTRDGQDYSGVISEQHDQELLLTTGAETSLRMARSEVVSMRPGTVSIMPSGLTEQLSLQELADLLAFLANTRWGAK